MISVVESALFIPSVAGKTSPEGTHRNGDSGNTERQEQILLQISGPSCTLWLLWLSCVGYLTVLYRIFCWSTPACSVLGTRFQLSCRIDTVFEAIFGTTLVSLSWMYLIAMALYKNSTKDLVWHIGAVHRGNMACLVHPFLADETGSVQNFKVCHLVLSFRCSWVSSEI